MKTPRDKYINDPQYYALVNTMFSHIVACNYTPSEMREAAILASIIYEENRIRMLAPIPPYPKEISESLIYINKWITNATGNPRDKPRTKQAYSKKHPNATS